MRLIHSYAFLFIFFVNIVFGDGIGRACPNARAAFGEVGQCSFLGGPRHPHSQGHQRHHRHSQQQQAHHPSQGHRPHQAGERRDRSDGSESHNGGQHRESDGGVVAPARGTREAEEGKRAASQQGQEGPAVLRVGLRLPLCDSLQLHPVTPRDSSTPSLIHLGHSRSHSLPLHSYHNHPLLRNSA